MCDKAVSTYSSTMKFVPECIMTKEMCSKAVSRCFFRCDGVVSEDTCFIVCCLDKYLTLYKYIKNV